MACGAFFLVAALAARRALILVLVAALGFICKAYVFFFSRCARRPAGAYFSPSLLVLVAALGFLFLVAALGFFFLVAALGFFSSRCARLFLSSRCARLFFSSRCALLFF